MIGSNPRHAGQKVRHILKAAGLASLAFAAGQLTIAGAQAQPFGGPEYIPGRYIVTLKEKPTKQGLPSPAVEAIRRRAGVAMKHVYSNALNGFAAELTDEALNDLRNDPQIAAIEQDQIVSVNQKKRPGGGGGGGAMGGMSDEQRTKMREIFRKVSGGKSPGEMNEEERAAFQKKLQAEMAKAGIQMPAGMGGGGRRGGPGGGGGMGFGAPAIPGGFTARDMENAKRTRNSMCCCGRACWRMWKSSSTRFPMPCTFPRRRCLSATTNRSSTCAWASAGKSGRLRLPDVPNRRW